MLRGRLVSLIVCALVVVMAIVLAGCSTQGAKKVVKIGVIAPLTGGWAANGIHIREASKLAVDEINAAGGVLGARLELLVEDDKSNPTEGVNAAKKLAPDVTAFIASVNSPVTLAIMDVAKEYGIPQITPGSSAPMVTQTGNQWIFRLHGSDVRQAQLLVDYAVNNLKAERIAMLSLNTDFGAGGRKAVQERMQKYGKSLVLNETANAGDTDFQSFLLKARDAKVQVILCWLGYAEPALMAKQAKAMGYDVTFMGQTALNTEKFLELAGDAAEGVYVTLTFVPRAEDPKVKKFCDDLKARANLDADVFSSQAYDATYIIAKAIENCGSFDRAKIRDAIRSIRYQGVTGEITFDETGENNRKIYMSRITNGKFKVID